VILVKYNLLKYKLIILIFPLPITHYPSPINLCRLRYFSEDNWSVAFYTYSHNKYEPSVFDNGTFHGTPWGGLFDGYLTD
jgi:hypothetical protein